MREIKGLIPNRVFTYKEYKEYVMDLFSKGMTSGLDQTESRINYTGLNIQRKKRWEKVYKLSEETKSALRNIQEKQNWVFFTEAWCGDGAPILPLINLMAEQNDNIEFNIILRDDNTEIMKHYLTNGGMSIPKIVVFENDEEKGDWGPRPAELQKMVLDNKYSDNPIPSDLFSIEIQKWYNKDKGTQFQKEILELVLQKEKVTV